SSSFLVNVGCGVTRYGSHGDLRATVTFFRRGGLPRRYTRVRCGISNSFTRRSLSARGGWTTGRALTRLRPAPAGCPGRLAVAATCELHLLRPAFALVMYGTNDLQRYGVELFRSRLRALLRMVMAAG